MLTTLIVQPVFNMLVFIYAILPGHSFGLSIIVFTILIRLLLWPVVKKQLHHAKAMRELQPEIRRIKKEAKGNKQKESLMVMELYKEREINPFASIGLLLLQLPILISLYLGINRIINEPQQIVDFAYPFIQNLGSIREIAQNVEAFNPTLFGFVDLTQAAVSGAGFYLPAFILVFASAVSQYFQTKQLMPDDKNARSLKQIMSDAGKGKQADQAEVSAAVGRSTKYFIPVMIFVVAIGLPSALPLYWLTSSFVAILQQKKILKQDETELTANNQKTTNAEKRAKRAKTAEVIDKPKSKKSAQSKSKSSKQNKPTKAKASKKSSKKRRK